jgi:hypothetical protein
MGLSRAELGDGVDLGEILDMAEDDVSDGRLTHLARKGDVARVIEMLATEEDHLPFEERVADRPPAPGGERPAQIDARDLGTDVQRERLHLDRTCWVGHCRLPRNVCLERRQSSTMTRSAALSRRDAARV